MDTRATGTSSRPSRVGPTPAASWPNTLAGLLDAAGRRPGRGSKHGRFVFADGSLARCPTRAVAIGRRRHCASPTGRSSRSRPRPASAARGVDPSGRAMDYDGRRSLSPRRDDAGDARYASTAASRDPLLPRPVPDGRAAAAPGAATHGPRADRPGRAGRAAQRGLTGHCVDRSAPVSTIVLKRLRRGRLRCAAGPPTAAVRGASPA